MSDKSSFFAELKRRNVYKVAVAYAVAGWALAQGIAQVFPVFGVPNWIIQLIVLLIVIGFPIALVFAWAFEITPEGLKRTEDVDLTTPHRIHGPWIYIVLVGVAVSISLFFLGRYTAPNGITSGDENKSIAVLPFATLSDDRDDAYFADGVQDQILTNLAKVSDLKVISHTSVRQYKTGAERNLRDALGKRPTGDGISDRDLVNIAPLQFGEELVHLVAIAPLNSAPGTIFSASASKRGSPRSGSSSGSTLI